MKIVPWKTAFFILTILTGPTEEESSYVKYVERGKDTILACQVERSQIINSLQWKHKRKPYCSEEVIAKLTSVSKEHNYEVTFKAESFKLKVSNMTQNKQGDYRCYANNVSKSNHTLYLSGN